MSRINIIRVVGTIFLLFNATGALYGGWSLMTLPDGSGLQMSVGLLQKSPFHNFFIPGLILFVFNGLLSIVVLLMLWFKPEQSFRFMYAQGFILTAWIIVQVLLIQTFFYLQLVFFGVGIAMLIFGFMLHKARNVN